MKTLKLKRLISNRRPFYVPEEGELLYELDTHRLYVGDGAYAGGYHVCNIDFSEVNDIPTTISGMFLKRNSSDTGYEWSHAASYFTDLKDVPLIYPSSDNYLHIVIDKNLVENDLTNAVVKLEISNNCGIDMKDLTYVINGFNEGLNELLSNSFVAPGTTPADSLVWEIVDTSLGSNSISIHNNEVKFSCVYGTSDTQSVRSMYYMSGDFDIQINWNQSTNVSPNRLFIGFGVSDDYNKYVDIRRHNYGTGAYQWVTYTETGYYDYGNCNFSSGTFRIKRVGSSFTCYIKNSGSDLWLASITKTHATIDNSVKVGLFVAVESTFPSIDVDFSDFIISSGKPCWSELHPYRKKLQITTINGVQCSTEIERFDTINSNITLHTIVPEISATYDTKLKLLYSLNMEDNTYVSDNVTNSGIENLVRYGVGSITESAYIGINEHRDGIELKLFNDSPYKFIDLYDTPKSYTPNKYLTTTASGIVLSDSAAFSSSFIDLTDTPNDYIQGRYLVSTSSGIAFGNYAPTQGTQTVTLTTSGTMNYGDDYSFRINDFDYNYNFGVKDDFLSLDIQRWTIFNQSDITTASVTEDRPGIKFTIKGILTTNKYLYVRNAFLLNGDYSITLYGIVINTDYNHSGLEICIHDASYSNIGYVKSGYYSGNAFMSEIASSGFASASRNSNKFTIRIVRSGTDIHSMYDDGQTGFFTTLRSSTTTTDPHSLVIGMWSAAAATTDQVVVVDKVIMDYGTVSLDSNFTQPTVSGMLSHLSNAVEYYSSVNSTVVDNSLSISSNTPFDLTNVENFTTNYYSSAVSPINDYEYKSETFTIEIGGRYQCDTSAGSFVVTTPENPVAMDEFTIADATGTFAANNLLVSGTQNIRGISDTLALDVNWATVNMVYINESIGWRY